MSILLCSCASVDENRLQTFELSDSLTQNTFKITVVLPEKYNPEESYKTLYVLDGNERYAEAGLALESTGKDDVLVVGIGYPDETQRTRDYSPSAWNVEGAGEANAFFNFVNNQLVPHIENQFATTNTREGRAITGHSLGGLAVAYAFLEFGYLFHDFVLISPALAWDEQYIFGIEEAQRINTTDYTGNMVFISGSYESNGMVSTMEAFAERIKNHHQAITVHTEVLPFEGHQSVVYPALESAFSIIY